jgi:hypothetical protein
VKRRIQLKIKLSALMIVFGAGIALLSSLADLIGLGSRGGVPAVQIVVAEVGVVVALTGVWLSIRRRSVETIPPAFWRGLPERVLSQPVFVWVIVGFLISYLLFFIAPTFMNSAHKFQYPRGFFIERENIGFDTRLTLEHVRVWFTGERQAKYIFPPLTTILFAPLLLLRYPEYYYALTAMTLVSVLILNLLLPLWMTNKENHLLVYFNFAISIFSYGLQFELETGQFYSIAMALALAAIYIFHRHPRYRIFAYVLFCISVQLKVFPAIFVLMFVDDWRDWKTSLKRFAALGLANFLLLFLLGFSYFSAFVRHLINDAATHEIEYNHSIYAFVAKLSATGYGLFGGDSLRWINANSGMIEAFLYLYFAVSLLIVLWRAYSQNARGVNASLLMACLLGGMMLPAISHDYKLPLLGAPFVLAMSDFQIREAGWRRIVSILLVIIASFVYSATFAPFNARPVYLESAFPLLFILLTAVTALSALRRETAIKNTSF